VECATCGEKTNCRVGMSNRKVQPFRFNCQDCGSPIDMTFGAESSGIVGAKRIMRCEPFDAETNFVDLHLDFPVSFEPYVMGETPFMRAFSRIGRVEMPLHSARLNALNDRIDKFHHFGVLLKLYAKGKIVPFRLNCAKTFDITTVSDKPEDINSALYFLIARMMMPFAYPRQNEDSVQLFQNALFEMGNKPQAIDDFVEEVMTTGFLKNLQLDCLEIYPRILAAELPMRPALFLDFDKEYQRTPIAMRVSTRQFEQYRDLFKDISEIISRQFVLIAAINNLQKRRSHNAFLPSVGMTKSGKDFTPTGISTFADVTFGQKQDFIDDPWYEMMDGAIDNHLRNAIAHYKAEYDEINQIVTYYPKREGIKQEKAEQTYFLEFMRRLLVAYREMHRLHHLIKILFYYYYLAMKAP
jgi:hypothetical protein